MKKSIKGIITFLALFFMVNVSAKQMNHVDIENIAKFDVDANETVYIFGKYVYFNIFKMADAEAAANTLNGATDAKIYYKDGANIWKYAIDDKIIAETELGNLKFEMIKLIGDKGENNHVSIDNNLYSNGYIKTLELADGRIADVFEDETAPTEIVNFRSVDPINLDTPEKTFNHEWNTNALAVNYDKGRKVLTLTENKPLQKYENGQGNHKWFAMLVETNRQIDRSNTKLSLKNFDGKSYVGYGINDEDINEAERHGGDKSTEFLIWLQADLLQNDTLLEVTYTDNEGFITVQTINIKLDVKAYEYASMNAPSGDKDKVTEISDDVKFDEEPRGNRTSWYIFYGPKEDLKTFTLKHEDKPYLGVINHTNNNIEMYPFINPETPKKGKPVDLGDRSLTPKHEWNQSAFDLSEPVEEEDGSYTITITKNKAFEKYIGGGDELPHEYYSLIVDLGVTPFVLDEAGDPTSERTLTSDNYQIEEIDYTDSLRHGGDTESSFVMWLYAEEEEQTITFTNAALENAARAVGETIEDRITVHFKYDDKVPQLAAKFKLGDAVDLDNDEDINTKFKNNMSKLNSIETGRDNDTDTYKVTVTSDGLLESFMGGNQVDSQWFSLIADFGVAPFALDKEATAEKFITGDNYEIEKIDYTDASRHGAKTTTAFVMWLNSNINGKTITFRNEETHDTVKVEISLEYRNLLQNNIAIGRSDFPGYTNSQTYNQDSIKKVTNPENTMMPETINVIMKRRLADDILVGNNQSPYYNIIVDFGVPNDRVTTVAGGYQIEDIDKEQANDHLPEGTTPNSNKIILWLNANDTDKEEGKTIIFKIDGVLYPVTIKSTYEENPLDMKLVGAKKLTIPETEIAEMKTNNKNIHIDDIYEHNIKITYDTTDNVSKLVSYDNGQGVSRKWFGFLLDLGIDKQYVEAYDNYRIEEIDKTDASRFGGDNDNQFIIWLSAEDFNLTPNEIGDLEGNLTLKFKNTNPENKYDTITLNLNLDKRFR